MSTVRLTRCPISHTMVSIGEHDDSSPIMALNLRASKTLSKTWRRNLQPQNPEEGHPRVWLMGDAIHAMQPNRQVHSRELPSQFHETSKHPQADHSLKRNGGKPSFERLRRPSATTGATQ